MKKILCLGNSTWDRFFYVERVPSEATKYFSNKFIELGGGVAATAAVAARTLGCEVKFAGRAGDDSTGKLIKNDLEKYGIDTTGLRLIPNAESSHAVVHVDACGERQITVHRDPSMPTSADFLSADLLDGVDCVLCDCTWVEGAERILTLANNRDIPTVIDADLGSDALSSMLPLADHVAFSHPALLEFTGLLDTNAALLKVQKLVKGMVYVTKGDEGCYWLENNELKHAEAYKVDVVDTTGAGDVFHGALAVAIAEKKQTREAVRFASAVAAMKCTKPGGRAGIPTRRETEEFVTQ